MRKILTRFEIYGVEGDPVVVLIDPPQYLPKKGDYVEVDDVVASYSGKVVSITHSLSYDSQVVTIEVDATVKENTW